MKQDLELFLKRVVFKDDYTIGKLSYAGYDEHNGIVINDVNRMVYDASEPGKVQRC